MEIIEGILYSDNSKVSIKIENGFIKEITKSESSSEDYKDLYYIAPGLFDNQINGYSGIEFSIPELSTEDMNKVVNGLRQNGVTTFLPTVITASQESLIKSFTNLAKTLKDENIALSIPGFHLEGPYISPVEGYRGAHSLKDIRKPDWDEFQKINEAAEGKIIQVTLAPEIEGAVEFIKKCINNNIVVSLGHHNGNAEDIKRAVDAGAKTVTHLGNGLANNINRFNNPLWMQLAEDRLMASFILDGFHLKPEMVKVFYRAKGKERFILTSDITMLAGMPPGEYIWDGKNVILTEEGIIMLPGQNLFAGASLPLYIGIGNMMKFTGCSLLEAIDMATKNPASLYGFDEIAVIEKGKRADFILFKFEENKLKIAQTIITGNIVYSAKN